jgi:cytochrome c1
MDDYFDVKKASVFTSRAQKLNPDSYTVAVINHLITAQMADRNSWCERFSGFDSIKQSKLLKVDFRTKASYIINEYLKVYKDYCTTSHSIKKFFKG